MGGMWERMPKNKVVHENKSEANNLSVVNKPNALYEALDAIPHC